MCLYIIWLTYRTVSWHWIKVKIVFYMEGKQCIILWPIHIKGLRTLRHGRHMTASHEQSCEQTPHTARADHRTLRLAYAHFTFCHSIAIARSRSTTNHEEMICQILKTGPTSQSRDWKSCTHGDVTHTSQYQSQSCATMSRVRTP